MLTAFPRRALFLAQLVSAFLGSRSVSGVDLPHRQCVKTGIKTSNRISCKPPGGVEFVDMKWDSIRMECNTTDADGKAAVFQLLYNDPWSNVVPTPSPTPSKWLGDRKAFMDVPACGVYVYYVADRKDPRLCAWHCYQVRKGQRDKELCIADATEDCGDTVSSQTTNTHFSSMATSHHSSDRMGVAPTSSTYTCCGDTVSSQTTNTHETPTSSSSSGKSTGSDSDDSDDRGIIIALIIITIAVAALLVFFSVREVKKWQLLRKNGLASKKAEEKKSKLSSSVEQKSEADDTQSKQKPKKEDSWGSYPDLQSEDGKSTGSSDVRKEKEYTMPEKVTDLSTSVHYTTPITVDESVTLPSPVTADEPANFPAPDIPAPTLLERSNSAESEAVNSVSSLLMSKYVLQYGKGFSRVGNLVDGRYPSVLLKGEPTELEPRASTLSENDGRCIVYPHKIHTAQEPSQ